VPVFDSHLVAKASQSTCAVLSSEDAAGICPNLAPAAAVLSAISRPAARVTLPVAITTTFVLLEHRSLKVTWTVTIEPAGLPKITKTFTITLKPEPKKHK
jgi:hypothetical protein